MEYPIDSKQIAVFITITQTLSIRQTSAELNLTPSAISHSLKCLEEDLGCRLFDRTSRKMSLTQNGENFLPEAIRILEIMSAARDKLGDAEKWKTGKLRLGASSTACQYILSSVVREFKESFPQINIKIESVIGGDAEKMLLEGALDMVIGVQPPEHRSVEFLPVSQDELCFVVHPLHPWAQLDVVPVGDIVNQQIIINSASSYSYDLLTKYYQPYHVKISPFIELANEEAIKEFVQLNMGVGIIPPWIAVNELRDGRLIALPLGEEPLRRNWGISYARYKSINFSENLFIGIIELVCKNIMNLSREQFLR